MKTIKRILVPTDFSENAYAAYQYALDMAEAFNASIKVIHVYADYDPEFPLADPTYVSNGKSLNMIRGSLDKFIEKGLENGSDESEGDAGVATYRKIKVESDIYYGSAVKDIVVFSQSGEFDLIVLGTAGNQNWGELMFGSVSTHVTQEADCPVLLVPSGAQFGDAKELLYACDFDHKSFKHVSLIADVAQFFKSNVHLLFVKTEENTRQDYLKDIEDMRTVFHTQAPQLTYTSDVIEEADVVDGINSYGKVNSIDMVVAVTKHRNFWNRMLHSSKTKELAIYSELPVLVIKADE